MYSRGGVLPGVITGDPYQKIERFYRYGFGALRPLPGLRYRGCTAFSSNSSLSDAVVLTGLARAMWENGMDPSIHSACPFFEELMRYCPWGAPSQGEVGVNIHKVLGIYQCGSGHVIQRLQRAWGLAADLVPKGSILSPCPPVPRRVFTCYASKSWIHGNERKVLEKARATMKQVYGELEPEGYEFVNSQYDVTFEDKFKKLASCEYYVGIPGGWMHLATALGRKCIVFVRGIEPIRFFLPMVRDVTDMRLMWFYPQNVHLHEEEKGDSIDSVTAESVTRALTMWPEAHLFRMR